MRKAYFTAQCFHSTSTGSGTRPEIHTYLSPEQRCPEHFPAIILHTIIIEEYFRDSGIFAFYEGQSGWYKSSLKKLLEILMHI